MLSVRSDLLSVIAHGLDFFHLSCSDAKERSSRESFLTVRRASSSERCLLGTRLPVPAVPKVKAKLKVEAGRVIRNNVDRVDVCIVALSTGDMLRTLSSEDKHCNKAAMILCGSLGSLDYFILPGTSGQSLLEDTTGNSFRAVGRLSHDPALQEMLDLCHCEHKPS
ncbi:hypothetical protein LZ30DRAFT_480346 [Colletotrichum cereale]|nr:hypothetical protein LZ30DRAFT_480346 [Colletotrichum cereale]